MSQTTYFLYARKSTEDDNKQVMSIEAQLVELREFAAKENLEITKEFQESKSAKTPRREVFGEMMEEIEDRDDTGILAWHPDRLARNSVDGGKIIHLVDRKKIVAMRFPTFWFEPTPQGLFMLQVAFGQSKYYSDNLSQNTKRGMRQKLRRGEWLTKAPRGYVNNQKTRNIEPHPTYSKVIVKAFKEYATSEHTYESLAEFLAEHGITTKTGAPLAKASIKRMLENRAYLGFTKYKDEWYEGSFDSILSVELFEAVQAVLKDKSKASGRKRQKHDFPFTGLFRCGECSCMITAQWATGKSGKRYRYYRCTKKCGECDQSYLQEHLLVAQLHDRLQTISLRERCTDYMLEKVDTWEKEESRDSRSHKNSLEAKLETVEDKLEKLVTLHLDGDIPKDTYLTKKDVLLREKVGIEEKLQANSSDRPDWIEPLREWILDTKQANLLKDCDDYHEMKSFIQKIGTNHLVRDKSARYHVAPPSRYAAEISGALEAAASGPAADAPLSDHEVSICDPDEI